jgi:hypothetical protein
VSIPPKKVRAELMDSSILLSDAKLIAKNIAGLRESTGKNPRRKNASRETLRREAMPQSLPDGFTPAPARTRKTGDAEKILQRLRSDVENNPDVSAMTSDEIVERFRKEVKP